MPIHVFVTLLVCVCLVAGLTLFFAQEFTLPIALVAASVLAMRTALALRP
ncbi:MAG: hypothetical protein QMB16_08140 [Paracoccaceae bacterium]